jgi:hypothetical protein
MDDVVAEAINDFALFVHDIVEFERALSLLEIVLLDAFLGLLDGFIQQRMLKFLAFFEAHFFHVFDDAVRAEQAHEIVFEADEKVRRPRIALARAPATQLPVNAAGFVAFCADDMQAADVSDTRAEFNVGAAACHVRRDGDSAALAGSRHDFGFLLVIFGVQDGVDDALLLEHAREQFADLD